MSAWNRYQTGAGAKNRLGEDRIVAETSSVGELHLAGFTEGTMYRAPADKRIQHGEPCYGVVVWCQREACAISLGTKTG